MLTELTLKPGNPFVGALFDRMAVRVEASRELLFSDCPPEMETKYAAWVRSLPECKSWPENKIAVNTRYIQEMTRRIVCTGYNEESFKQWSKDNKNHWYPIRIALSERGDLALGDGNRRAIALMMAGQPIRAEVYGRHPKWRDTVAHVTRSGAWLYQPHDHPEFDGVKVGRSDGTRFRVVGEKLAAMGAKTVAVLGSNYGLGCVILAEKGLRVTGVEHSEHFERMQRSAFSVSPQSELLTSLLGDVRKCPPTMDAVVGLSVWHHLSQSVAMLDDCIRHFSGARLHAVELPEPTSEIWPETLVTETGLRKSELTQFVLDRICDVGGYKVHEQIFSDPKYNGRVTHLLT